MSHIENRRKYLTASHLLATSMQPTKEMVIAACETLAAVLADLEGEEVFIIPLSREEAQGLVDRHTPSQEAADSQKGGGDA